MGPRGRTGHAPPSRGVGPVLRPFPVSAAVAVAVALLAWVPPVPAWSQTGEADRSFWRKIPGPARYYHSATLLATGKVMVAGGCEPAPPGTGACATATDKVEVFDPATATWSPVGKMSTPRLGHAATVLPGGDVLVVGGCSGITPDGICASGQANSAERYNATAGTWARVTGFEPLVFLGIFRGHTLTLQPEGPDAGCGAACGKVLVVGPSNALVWDPATATSVPTARRVTPHGSLLLPLLNHTATRLPGGRVVFVAADLTSIYDTASDSWAAGANPSGRDHFSASLLAPDRVLVSGGVEPDGSPTPFPEIYEADAGEDPATRGAWRPVTRPSVTRFAHAAAEFADGEVLITGGRDAAGKVVPAAEVYEASTDRWRPAGAMTRPRGGAVVAKTSPMFASVSLTATVLADARVLVVGGDGEETADLYGPLGEPPMGASPAWPGRGRGSVAWWTLGFVPAAVLLVVVVRRRTKSRQTRR